MAYPRASHAYTNNDVMTASPPRLLIIIFDYLIAQMTRARIGIEKRDLDILLPALDRSRQALGELLAGIDHNAGGELAHRLTSLYAFVMAETIEIGRTQDATRLARNLHLIQEVRDAFATAAASLKVEVA